MEIPGHTSPFEYRLVFVDLYLSWKLHSSKWRLCSLDCVLSESLQQLSCGWRSPRLPAKTPADLTGPTAKRFAARKRCNQCSPLQGQDPAAQQASLHRSARRPREPLPCSERRANTRAYVSK